MMFLLSTPLLVCLLHHSLNVVNSQFTPLAMCAHVAGMLGLDLLKLESLRIRLAINQKEQATRLSDGTSATSYLFRMLK